MDDIYPNKIAAEFIQANLENAVAYATKPVRSATNALKAKLQRTYKAYLQRLLERYSRSKSFFVRSESLSLYSFFVPLDLLAGDSLLQRAGIEALADVARTTIIVGTGGSGKSMIMRHLLIDAVRTKHKTPIFLELRSLNTTSTTLREHLLEALQQGGLEVDDDYFQVALEAGHFCVLLDGFDELNHSRRREVAEEIRKLSDKYSGNWFILSSRPDSELEGWTAFTQMWVQPLSIDRAVEMITKMPFETAVKDRFVAELRRNLFEQHRSFLSNPLLLSIMLVTYGDVAHIPNKLSVFYEQAYESLFQKHDALKSGYQRQRLTELDVREFANVFSAFSLLSFDAREFEFTRMRALELVEQSKRLSLLDYKAEEFLKDSVQAVCLMVEEGLQVTFAHRSFQEFFAARFIQQAPPEHKLRLIERFRDTMRSDAVIQLLFEMDRNSVEKVVLLPALASFRSELGFKKSLTTSQYLKALRQVYSAFNVYNSTKVRDSVSATVRPGLLFDVVMFVETRYLQSRQWQTKEPSRPLGELLRSEFGGDSVKSSDLTEQSELLRAMRDGSVFWGKELFEAVFDVEDMIRAEHAQSKLSLQELLGV